MRKIHYRINNSVTPTVTISKLMKGDKFYAEIGTGIVFSDQIQRRILLPTELEGEEDYTPVQMPTRASQLYNNLKKNIKKTIALQRTGERPFVLYEALDDYQKITLNGLPHGTIMPWNATPLARGEYYLHHGEKAKSVFDLNGNIPHGTLITVRRSLLVADFRVSVKGYHTGNEQVRKFTETRDSFEIFSGNGLVFLELDGSLIQIPLYPGESVDVKPGFFLGSTESVTLNIKSAGKLKLRKEENNDFLIHCTAGPLGGYVYARSVNPKAA